MLDTIKSIEHGINIVRELRHIDSPNSCSPQCPIRLNLWSNPLFDPLGNVLLCLKRKFLNVFECPLQSLNHCLPLHQRHRIVDVGAGFLCLAVNLIVTR
jgi:hypothetical protein